MHKFSAQLTLGLRLRDEATFATFYPGKNSEIVTELKKSASGEGERVIFLSGTRGQGCSHLLQASCHYAHQFQLSSVYLPLSELFAISPEVLNGLESLAIICIDDLQVIAGHAEWEESIFHLYNRIYDAGGRILIAANNRPKRIKICLPDLVSRLSFGMVYQLQALTDEEKLLVLMMRAHHRGMSLSEDVAKYILHHCKRHMGTLFATLDILDKASLASKRRLTVPFVKEVLQI